MKNRYRYLRSRLLKGFRFQSLIIILANIIALFIVNVKMNYSMNPAIINIVVMSGLEIIVIVSIVLVVYNFFSVRFLSRHYLQLINSIEKIANGDFSVRLDPHKTGFFSPLYEDFNKMAAELQDISILRNDFINNYSHEFKTPVVAINGFANLLLEQHIPETEQKQYLRIIADESCRLADLANNTLLLSRLNSQQIVTGREDYSLDEQLRRCVIVLSVDWNKKNIDLSGDLAEINYNGNHELMQHLWLNLLSNAIKYTPVGGEILVSLYKDGEYAVIKIADNGIGMDKETVSHIFDEYYQGSANGSENGLGLGLAIAKRIIELSDGTISVESKENEGSTFTVRLPL